MKLACFITSLAVAIVGVCQINAQTFSNANFEAGNIGFSSDYQFAAVNSDEGQFSVRIDPQNWNEKFVNFGDHTTGAGRMLVVNGATSGNLAVWRQTISIEPKTSYRFQAWTGTAVSGSPANLILKIDGHQIGTSFVLPNGAGAWVLWEQPWTSSLGGAHVFEIINANTSRYPNDFYIDDIGLIKASIVQEALIQGRYDLAADFSPSKNPNEAWSFGWMAPDSTVFKIYTSPFNAHGLELNAWRGGGVGDGGSAPPHVIRNPTDIPLTASDTTWLPHEVTFHPGQQNERSVVRWTSPFTGPISLAAVFEGRSGFATSGVEIYQNRTLLFSRLVSGNGAASRRSVTAKLVVQLGDTIDFRVNYGNGSWDSDTTQIGVIITPVPAAAPDSFKWTTIRGAIAITEYNGSGGAVNIPGSIHGLPVRSIEEGAFKGCTRMTSVMIPNSVIRIGEDAFRGCSELMKITVDALNSAYSSVDGVLFDKGTNTLILCPAGKTGNYTLPNGVNNIEHSAFSSCTSLTGVSIPNSVTMIGDSAFRGCNRLTSVTLANGVATIGNRSFSGCSSLTAVTIPNSVTSLGDSAFLWCTSLTSVIIGDGVASIGRQAFFSCPNLRSATIGSSVTNIGYKAFNYTALINLTVPDSVKTIESDAFAGCSSLTNVSIGNGLKSIGEYAFMSCTRLKGIYFQGNAPLMAKDGFFADPDATVYYLPGTKGWRSTFGGRPTALWKP